MVRCALCACLTSQTTVVPTITVQYDAADVDADVLDGLVGADRFWISVYKTGAPSVHGHVRVTSEVEGELRYEASPDLQVERVSNVRSLHLIQRCGRASVVQPLGCSELAS